MKTLLLCLLFIAASSAEDIKVNIQNIDISKGKLYIGLYNNPKTFKSFQNTYQKKIVAPKEKNMRIIFKNVSNGKYAISLFQDTNGNKRIDKNFLGVPKEAYGFSNNPSTLFEPNFEDAEFSVDADTKLTVEVHY